MKNTLRAAKLAQATQDVRGLASCAAQKYRWNEWPEILRLVDEIQQPTFCAGIQIDADENCRHVTQDKSCALARIDDLFTDPKAHRLAQQSLDRAMQKLVADDWHDGAPKSEDELCARVHAVSLAEPVNQVGYDLAFLQREFSEHAFKRHREELANQLTAYYCAHIFGVRVREHVHVAWNKRLCKTAGVTRAAQDGTTGLRTARIELSWKVVDRTERLRNTLAHELCHAAQWIVDREKRPHHGASFKLWALKAAQFDPTLLISRCHSYQIAYKFVYRCTNAACGVSYGRNSKSIDLQRSACGKCRGRLELT
ncbi:HMG box-containing protein C19G7.04 [Porphyridium purpureum]|uniref:HMG box-containing protein C19G7.04 n=1 Tax=Porphyridium purpureum TaxID=35688 RepID=A0A5J4YIF9_PORPP|nr:HMG box-containing protein C19G7.04 [Porphyridium purpureum]|eukprot:POR0176..scf267_23